MIVGMLAESMAAKYLADHSMRIIGAHVSGKDPLEMVGGTGIEPVTPAV
jgi:hypothetical protein